MSVQQPELDGVAGHARAVIAGETRARDFLMSLSVRLTTGDELAALVERIHDRRELAAFCRYLQKVLERAGPG
jgi:hypothetical protein